MMRFFTSMASREANKLAEWSGQKICKELGVKYIDGSMKIVEHPKPGEKNVVSAKKLQSVLNKAREVTPKEYEEAGKILEEAQRRPLSW